MSREVTKRTIDDVEYTVTQFDPKTSLEVLTKIGKVMGGPMGDIFGKVDRAKPITEQEIDVGALLTQVFSSIGEDDLYPFMRKITKGTIARAVEDKKGKIPGGALSQDDVFDNHFWGSQGIMRMFKVGKLILEVNYGSFFAAAFAEK